MTQSPRTIAIVEDEAALRESLVQLLQQQGNWRIVGTYPNAELALAELKSNPPQIVLMDIQLPGKSGIECASELKAAHPDVQILMITVYDDTSRVFQALAAGASGYLLKRDVPTRLHDSLADLEACSSPVSSRVARKLFQFFATESHTPAAPDFKLSPRESQILEKMTQGRLNKEIADELSIGIETVHFHVRNIYKKLHVRTRTEAVVKYLGR